ncbi:MAG TPA: hypothetical protein VGE94_05950 [Chloroflexota bacterium]
MAWLPDEDLGDKQLRTVILRLVLDRFGALWYGEVTDVDGQPVSRVMNWEQLLDSIKAYVGRVGSTR